MKVIISGGRNGTLTKHDFDVLNSFHEKYKFTEVVTGGCRGIDKDGMEWAKLNNIPITVFPADWAAYGKSAGPFRNEVMAHYADACICFPGGKGTNDMARKAQEANLLFWDFRCNK